MKREAPPRNITRLKFPIPLIISYSNKTAHLLQLNIGNKTCIMKIKNVLTYRLENQYLEFIINFNLKMKVHI